MADYDSHLSGLMRRLNWSLWAEVDCCLAETIIVKQKCSFVTWQDTDNTVGRLLTISSPLKARVFRLKMDHPRRHGNTASPEHIVALSTNVDGFDWRLARRLHITLVFANRRPIKNGIDSSYSPLLLILGRWTGNKPRKQGSSNFDKLKALASFSQEAWTKTETAQSAQ